jgi:uncharacterized Zn finger protein
MRLTKTTKDGSVAMSNNYQDWDDEEDDFEQPRQQSDSDLLKQLRKELKTKSKMLNDMETQLSTIKAEQRQSTIKSVLESKGVSPKIAKFIPQDIEPSAEAVNSWIEENAEIFGLTVTTPSEQEEPNLATLRQIDAVTANAQTPAGSEDLLLRIQQAGSAEELEALIYAQGGGYGS